MRVGTITVALLLAMPGSATANQWRLQPAPEVGGQRDGQLFGVSCVTAQACTAVGNYTDSHGIGRSLAARWNGRGWAVQRTPGGSTLNAVWCTNATICTAVGGFHAALALRWSADMWRSQPVPTVRGPLRWLQSISCPRADACMAVGISGPESEDSRPFAVRWDGHRWSVQPVPLPRGAFGGELKGVSCTGGGACIVVGDYAGIRSGGQKLLVERWDGRRFTVMHAPNPAGDSIQLNAVSCPSADWCDAAGVYEHSSGGAFLGLAEQWDGRRWRIERLARPARGRNQFELLSISCAKRGSCTAVGDLLDRRTQSHVLGERLAGGRWSVQAVPDPPGLGGQLGGVSCTTGAICVAVGWQQTPDVTSPPRQFVERYS